ncbi:hypothetical protein L2E82_46445 [Cichorium intybus]|uniref:Uncharacterized protein n=1 Tax=Cichorium intybus TaxID=13427 RepID=A0ACB8YT68_CICIN|nr:hypothetical protein L2E82_46445 [Cichorium intybus]
METMIPNTCVALNVIDIWIFILNHEEWLKTKHKPKKVYCNVIHLKKEDFDEDADLEALYKIFEDNTNNTLKKCKIKNLKKVDLVFFPISHHSHYYVYVFDLNKKVVHLLDNIKNKKVGYYCKSPKRMVDFFSRFGRYRGWSMSPGCREWRILSRHHMILFTYEHNLQSSTSDLRLTSPTIYAFTQSLPDLRSTLRQRRVSDNEVINFIRPHRHYVFDATLRLHLRTSSPSHQNLSHHHIKPLLILGRHAFPRISCSHICTTSEEELFDIKDKLKRIKRLEIEVLTTICKYLKNNQDDKEILELNDQYNLVFGIRKKKTNREEDDEESDDGEDENGESDDNDTESTFGSCMKI